MKNVKITIGFCSVFVLFFFAANTTFPKFPVGPGDNQSETPFVEYEVKAGFIGNFVNHCEWPANSTAANPDTLFIIGALEENDVTSFLIESAKTKKIGGKQAKILIISDDAEIKNCNVLYISGISAKRLQKILEIVDNLPILTVADVPDFEQKGVMINMFNMGKKMRFSVNLTAVRENGLLLSSKLLRLALDVI